MFFSYVYVFHELFYFTSFFIFTQAFDLDISYIYLPFILGLTSLGVAIPSAPGGIGPFQLAFALSTTIVIGLGWENTVIQNYGNSFISSEIINAQWETYFAAIISCSIVLHACHIFSVSIIGLYFFIKSNVSLKEITNR